MAAAMEGAGLRNAVFAAEQAHKKAGERADDAQQSCQAQNLLLQLQCQLRSAATAQAGAAPLLEQTTRLLVALSVQQQQGQQR